MQSAAYRKNDERDALRGSDSLADSFSEGKYFPSKFHCAKMTQKYELDNTSLLSIEQILPYS